jgi:hypothetical protein
MRAQGSRSGRGERAISASARRAARPKGPRRQRQAAQKAAPQNSARPPARRRSAKGAIQPWTSGSTRKGSTIQRRLTAKWPRPRRKPWRNTAAPGRNATTRTASMRKGTDVGTWATPASAPSARTSRGRAQARAGRRAAIGAAVTGEPSRVPAGRRGPPARHGGPGLGRKAGRPCLAPPDPPATGPRVEVRDGSRAGGGCGPPPASTLRGGPPTVPVRWGPGDPPGPPGLASQPHLRAAPAAA